MKTLIGISKFRFGGKFDHTESNEKQNIGGLEELSTKLGQLHKTRKRLELVTGAENQATIKMIDWNNGSENNHGFPKAEITARISVNTIHKGVRN